MNLSKFKIPTLGKLSLGDKLKYRMTAVQRYAFQKNFTFLFAKKEKLSAKLNQ